MKAKIDRGDNFVLIDVREPHEYQICNIPRPQLIPLGELPKRVGELNTGRRDRDPLQERRAQREGRRLPDDRRASSNVLEHEGRHSGLERQGRPERSEVLTGYCEGNFTGDGRRPSLSARLSTASFTRFSSGWASLSRVHLPEDLGVDPQHRVEHVVGRLARSPICTVRS